MDGENASPPSPIVSSNPTLNPSDQSKHARIMENLKAAVLLRLTNSNPTKTLSSAQIAAVATALKQAFPSFSIPTHPTYASMIQKAIEELNEERGSVESSISEYILANYKGLPWAHKSYLSHYLNVLCENGEIVCNSDKCYTIPGLIRKPKSKKKQLRAQSRRKTKENLADEGNLGGGQLIIMSETEVCFQEEETQVYVKNRTKSRRNSMVVYEEDEEVGGTEVVVREGSLAASSLRAVIEGKNKLNELNCRDEVGKDSEFRQHGFGIHDKGNDTVIIEEDLSTTQQLVGVEGGIEPQAGLIESTVDKLLPKECQDEVRTEVFPLDQDYSGGRTELLLPSVPLTVEKRQVGSKTLQLDPESSDANLVSVPIENAKNKASERSSGSTELMLSFPRGNQDWSSVSDIGGDTPEATLKKSAILERDQSSRAAELMIVPFEGDPISVVQNEMNPVLKEREEIIVCALPYGVPVKSIRKPRFSSRKKRLKDCETEPLLWSEISVVGPKLLEYKQTTEGSLQTGRETKRGRTLRGSSKLKQSPLQIGHASPMETIPVIPVEEASLKHELEKQKLLFEPSPSSGAQELMSTDDENIPLHKVLQKCGRQRKLSEGITTSKAPVASLSAVSGAKLEAELPGSGEGNNESTRRKRKKKQEQQLQGHIGVQDQKHNNLEVDNVAAPKSEVFLSFQCEDGRDKARERHGDQEPLLSDSLVDVAAGNFPVKHLNEQQGNGQVEGSGSCVEWMPETVCLDSQSHELRENQQEVRDQGLSAEVGKITEVSFKESTLPQNRNEQKEEHVEQNGAVNVDMTASLSSLHHHLGEPSEADTDHQHSQLQSEQAEGDACGLLEKRSGVTNEAAVAAPEWDLDQQLQGRPSESAVQGNEQPRRESHKRLQKQEQRKEGLSEPAICQMQNKKLKSDGRGMPSKKEADSNLDHEQLYGLSGLTVQHHSQQQNKQLKRDRHRRPRQTEVEVEENEVSLMQQQQELPILQDDTSLDASIASNQLDQKEGQRQGTNDHNNFQDSELLVTSEVPSALGNQPDQMSRVQKQHVESKSFKSEAAATSLDTQTLQQCQVQVLKSTPAPVLTEDESCQQTEEHKPHHEENLLHSFNEQSGKSQYQVHEVPSDQEQATVLSVNETPDKLKEHEEDWEGQLPRSKPKREPLADQPCQQQEEEQCRLHEEKLEGSRDQGKTPKQKSAKTRAVEVPLSSKDILRSRTKRQSQART